MTRARLAVLALHGAVFGCGRDQRFVESPPGAPEAAMILSVEGPAASLGPVASPVRGPVLLRRDDAWPDEARLVARVFDEDLAALGLERGELRVSSSGGRPLRHARSYELRLGDAPESGWQERAVAPLAVPEVVDPCPPLEVRTQPLDTTSEIGFVLALDGTRAWVGTRDGRLWEVTPDTVVEREPFGEEVPRDVGHRGPRGDFWLAGAGGRLYQVGASTSSITGRLVVDDPSLGLLQWLAGGELEGGGYEVFAKSQEGIVIRVRGSASETAARVDVVHRFLVPRAGRGGGVAWLGPGRAAVGSEWSGELVLIEEDRVSFERPPLGENVGITAVSFRAPFRIVVGSSRGTVAALEDAWRSLGDSGISFLIHALVLDGESFFALGTLGYVSRYDPEGVRFCEAQKVGQSSTYAAAVLDDYVLLADTNPNAARTFARFIRR